MGMFDDVSFEGDLPLMVQDDMADGWQTKDLYNCLYHLVVKESKLYYKDRKGDLHFLPLTKSFEVYNYSANNEFKTLRLGFHNGISFEVSAVAEGKGLPDIPAMATDADEGFQEAEETFKLFKDTEAKRSLLFKARRKLRTLRFDLGQVFSALKYAVKRFFGFNR